MKSFLEALNRPADAFNKKNKLTAWVLVFIAILINSVLEPILNYFAGIRHPNIDMIRMLRITALGCASYIAICIVLWFVCKCFGSKTPLSSYIKAWGISYIPTILCSIVVALTETFFYVFWNNTIWGMLLNIMFVGILIWKTILYVIFLQEVAELKRGKLVGAFFVIGIFILIFAAFNGYVGLKTPIL